MGIAIQQEGPGLEPALALPMRRVGLVGGMSWRSTALYYERLNLALERRLGAHRGFEGLVWNLDYARLLATARAGDWNKVEAMICEAAAGLADAGCELVALTAVTAHLFRDAAEKAANRPVPHVLSGTARELDRLRVHRVGVLGTTATCGAPFLEEYLGGRDRVLLRLDPDRQHRMETMIQDVLTAGAGNADAAGLLRDSVAHLRGRGAQTVVLACTELPLLPPVPDAGLPIVDSVALHVEDICNSIVSDIHAG